MVKIISICGNIACGKSTLMRYLRDEMGMKVHLEQISEWGKLLEKSYTDPHRYTVPFQLRVVSDQTLQREQISAMEGDDVVFIERSSDDGRYIFIEAKKQDGFIDDMIVAEFDRWFDVHKMGIQPDLTIYLQISPEKAYTRCANRHQTGDSEIGLPLLQQLHDLYEKRYNPEVESQSKYPFPDKVLILTPDTVEEMAKKVISFVGK